MGYWNYELCHGDYLRQYHEEKLEDGQVRDIMYIESQSLFTVLNPIIHS